MKRKTCFSAFALIAASAVLLTTGCEKEATLGADTAITITAEGGTITVDEAGGTFEIPYEITGAVDGATVSASCESDWISDIDCSVDGKVTFTASANYSGDKRIAIMTVSYGIGNSSVSDYINLIQADGSYDYELTALILDGTVYDGYGQNGEINFFTWLSDIGFDQEGYTQAGGTYYRFDIFAPEDSGTTLPAGTYTLGEAGATAAWTFTPDYSMGVFQHQTDQDIFNFSEGTLVVTVNGSEYTFDAVLTDTDGGRHHVTYTGPAEYMQESQGGTGIITEDTDFTASISQGTYLGGENDVMNMSLLFTDMTVSNGYLMPPGNIMYVNTYLPMDENGSLATGTYNVSSDCGDSFTIAPAQIDNSGGMQTVTGTYLMYAESETSVSYGFVTGGTMTISGSAASGYNVQCNFTTDDGVSIECSYSGTIDIFDLPEDIALDLSGATGTGYYYGDYYGTGGSNWILSITPASGSGDGIQIECVTTGTGLEDGISSGTYTAAAAVPNPGEFYPGYLYMGYLYGTCYLSFTQGNIMDYAGIAGGSFTVTNNGDGTYRFVFDLVDGVGSSISGEWSGSMTLTDESESASASVKARLTGNAERLSRISGSEPTLKIGAATRFPMTKSGISPLPTK